MSGTDPAADSIGAGGQHLRVVGGGLAGLVASIVAAEAGADVELLETRRRLGGRARTNDGEFRPNLGVHAIYVGLPMWDWLEGRGLLPEYTRGPMTGVKIREGGKLRRLPPSLIRGFLGLRRRVAPVDESFRSWAERELGARLADLLCGVAGATTFDHDPGRLSARFVRDRLVDVYVPPKVRYIPGGWQALVDKLTVHAERVGVRITTGVTIETLPEPPVIVATQLREAASLLDEPQLDWEGTRTLLLDLGLSAARGQPFAVFDADEHGFVERITGFDSAAAPAGRDLIQAHIGLRPNESPDEGEGRLAALLDLSFRDWQERTVWRRRLVMDRMTGALDLPGKEWRDRPAVERRPGTYLAGDMVAAPGVLSEVATGSAVEAANRAVAWMRERSSERFTRHAG